MFTRYSLLREIRTRTLDIGFECLMLGPGGANKIQPPKQISIWELLGDMDSGTSLEQYSSSTNRAQYSLTPSSESGSVKWAQQR